MDSEMGIFKKSLSIWLCSGLIMLASLFGLCWWLLPIYSPELVIVYSPWEAPAKKAVITHLEHRMTGGFAHHAGRRAGIWGNVDAFFDQELYSKRAYELTDNDMYILGQFVGLKELSLDNSGVSDLGLAQLHELRELRKISLKGTKVTDAGVNELRRHLPDCQVIY